MFTYMRGVRRHMKGDEGASAVEYGLLVAAIAAVIVVVVFALGGLVKSKFSDTCGEIQSGGQTSVATGNCSK